MEPETNNMYLSPIRARQNVGCEDLVVIRNTEPEIPGKRNTKYQYGCS